MWGKQKKKTKNLYQNGKQFLDFGLKHKILEKNIVPSYTISSVPRNKRMVQFDSWHKFPIQYKFYKSMVQHIQVYSTTRTFIKSTQFH